MPRHVLILSFVAWGHLRPECNLAFRLAKRFSDLTVSLIVDTGFQANAKGELSRVADDTDKIVLERVRIIAAGNALKGFTPQVMLAVAGTLNPKDHRSPSPESTKAVLAVVAKIMSGKDFTDENGELWKGIMQKPSLLISDMFMADAALPIKNQYNIPAYILWVGCAGAFGRLYGPLACGGQAEGYVEECDAIESDPKRANGRAFVDIARQMFAYSGRYPNDIVQVKGLTPCYEWEDYPQDYWLPAMYWSIAGVYPFVQKADGFLVATVNELDGEGVEGLKEWICLHRPRPVLPLGPLLPSSYLKAAEDMVSAPSTAQTVEAAISYLDASGPVNGEVDPSLAFLNAALQKYGPKSVLYISFGTIFVPRADHIRYLFDVLLNLEEPIPFLFAAASPLLTLSEDLKQRVQESGFGQIVPWAPQQSVILHPATSFVLSHCGAGGLTESLCAGLPIIAWPQAADQPQNARWLSEVLDVAFELLQVRSGSFGEKKAFRGGGTKIIGTEEAIKSELKDLLRKMTGEEGKTKRRNAQAVMNIIQEAGRPGGSIEQSFDALGKAIL